VSSGQPQNDAQQPADTRIEKLFLELGGIYGYLWKSMHKTVAEWAAAKHHWSKKLFQENDYQPDEINFAIDACMRLRTHDGQFRIPTLPEFLDFAKQKCKRNLEDRIRENQEKIIKLAKKPVDPMLVEAAKKEWQKFVKRKNINPHA
jgi:bifunctional pyridoxal-dependent enzyme with beta-cystathionase and maltose regulon repressor activities